MQDFGLWEETVVHGVNSQTSLFHQNGSSAVSEQVQYTNLLRTSCFPTTRKPQHYITVYICIVATGLSQRIKSKTSKCGFVLKDPSQTTKILFVPYCLSSASFDCFSGVARKKMLDLLFRLVSIVPPHSLV